MRKLQTTIMILVLVGAALGLMYLKVTTLGLPLVPGHVEQVWTIEARIEFDGRGAGEIVSFDVPDDLGQFQRLEEYFVSRKYGLNITDEKRDRRAQWSTRRAKGSQRLYYRIEVAPRAEELILDEKKARAPKAPQKPEYEEPLASAVQDTLGEVRAESANIFTFVGRLLDQLNAADPDGNELIIRGGIDRGSEAWVDRLIYVLAGARITARKVRGILLEDGASNQHLTPWLEVHNGETWAGFNPLTGAKGYPENFVRWSVGSDPVLTVENGRNARVAFAISQYNQSLTAMARDRADASHSWLSNLMLFSLPVNTQNVYRILLMIPFGALVVALMRTIVGVPTIGTFMSILIAIAFRETELLWGVVLFTLITSTGLTVRFYLERLQLLLVPRLCAVVVVVVLLMLAISLISARLGLDRGFSIALFPIVILTMVIEHMSMVWEEAGPGEVLKEGLGTLVVASLGFVVMTNDYLTHLVFLFPEVLLIVFAAFLLMGRYTGYRVVEIMRFKDIVERPGPDVQPHP